MVVRSTLFCVFLVVLIFLIRENDTVFNKMIKPTTNFMKPTAINCVFNPKRVTNVSCTMKAISRAVSEINIYATLLEPLRNISVRYELYKFYNGYRPFMQNITEYWCEFMAGRGHSPLTKIVARLLKNTSNLNTTCPIKDYLIIRGLKYVAKYFPLASVVSKGKYKLVVTAHEDSEIEPYFGAVTLKLQVDENIQQPQ